MKKKGRNFISILIFKKKSDLFKFLDKLEQAKLIFKY